MQVHFLSDAPRVAGSEIWLLTLLPLLRNHGIVPKVHLPSYPSLSGLSQRFAEAHIAVEHYQNLNDHLRRQKSGLWVVQAWQPSLYERCLKHLQQPKIAVVHDQIDFFYPGVQSLYRWAFFASKAPPLRRFDGLITVSQWAAQLMRERGYPQVQELRNGVDPEVYKPQPLEREALRKRWGLDGFCVVVPGRLAPEKNPLAALRTARLLPQMQFFFVGDDRSQTGRLCHRLRRRWGLKNVFFWGKRWEMPQIYGAMDAVLQPTLAENQSLVTLEAMASQRPIVTSNIPAQQELITHGLEGLCVEPQPRRLAASLLELSQNPGWANRLAHHARVKVVSHHTLQHTSQHLADLLKGYGKPVPLVVGSG